MSRRHDWASRLYGVIDAHKSREFAWGENDCCLFASRCVDAMTTNAITYLIRERYHDERTALKFMAEYGGLAGAVSRYMGDPTNQRATRGDVVLIDGGEGDALGICLGSNVVAMGPKGLRYVPRAEIKLVWKV
jgi:hypothetical protein